MLTFGLSDILAVIVRGIADAQENGGFRDPHDGLSDVDNRKPGLWLVGDQGVYLCSNGELAEGARPLVAYAAECDPRIHDDWFEVKRRTFGGDDGIDFLDAIELDHLILAAPGATHLQIIMDDTSMSLSLIRR